MSTQPSDISLLLYHIGSQNGIGNATLSLLSRAFSSSPAKEIFPEKTIESLPLPQTKKQSIRQAIETFDRETVLEELNRYSLQLIALCDTDYPPLLKEIHNPPTLLFLRGSREVLTHQAISLVGTRKPTRYGIDVARTLSRELSSAGFVVISGMALGIDAEIHRGALEARGRTLAVLGNGLSDTQITPKSNLQLMGAIIQSGGSIVSELWPETPASSGTFPARNRIISGLSMATIIIEATERSGTIITAQLALEQNREVFAVPGSLFSELSKGPNRLIRDGAHIVTCAQDILDFFPSANISTSGQSGTIVANLSAEETSLLHALETEPQDRESLSQVTHLSPSKLAVGLTFLEMKGLIKDIGNGTYRKI